MDVVSVYREPTVRRKCNEPGCEKEQLKRKIAEEMNPPGQVDKTIALDNPGTLLNNLDDRYDALAISS